MGRRRGKINFDGELYNHAESMKVDGVRERERDIVCIRDSSLI